MYGFLASKSSCEFFLMQDDVVVPIYRWDIIRGATEQDKKNYSDLELPSSISRSVSFLFAFPYQASYAIHLQPLHRYNLPSPLLISLHLLSFLPNHIQARNPRRHTIYSPTATHFDLPPIVLHSQPQRPPCPILELRDIPRQMREEEGGLGGGGCR